MTKAKSIFILGMRYTQRNLANEIISSLCSQRVLYTYEYEVGVNNDELHLPALVFILNLSSQELSPSVRVGARTCPVLPGEAGLLATRQAGRRTPRRLTAVAGRSFKWRTPGRGWGGGGRR